MPFSKLFMGRPSYYIRRQFYKQQKNRKFKPDRAIYASTHITKCFQQLHSILTWAIINNAACMEFRFKWRMTQIL